MYTWHIVKNIGQTTALNSQTQVFRRCCKGFQLHSLSDVLLRLAIWLWHDVCHLVRLFKVDSGGGVVSTLHIYIAFCFRAILMSKGNSLDIFGFDPMYSYSNTLLPVGVSDEDSIDSRRGDWPTSETTITASASTLHKSNVLKWTIKTLWRCDVCKKKKKVSVSHTPPQKSG